MTPGSRYPVASFATVPAASICHTRNVMLRPRDDSIAGPDATPAPGARLTCAEYVGRSEVVPGTTLADLDDVNLELPVFQRHFIEFWPPLDPSFILAEFVAVYVGHMGQPGPAADRAGRVGGLSVELRGPQQVRVRVADVGDRGLPEQHGFQRRPLGERVVDDRTHRAHPRQGTTDARRGRARNLAAMPGLRSVTDQHILPMYRTDTMERYIAKIRRDGSAGRGHAAGRTEEGSG